MASGKAWLYWERHKNGDMYIDCFMRKWKSKIFLQNTDKLAENKLKGIVIHGIIKIYAHAVQAEQLHWGQNIGMSDKGVYYSGEVIHEKDKSYTRGIIVTGR